MGTSLEAVKKARKLLLRAQNNLAPSRHAAHVYGDGEEWDDYEEAILALDKVVEKEEAIHEKV